MENDERHIRNHNRLMSVSYTHLDVYKRQIQNYERAQIAERSVTHGEQTDRHPERGLPDSRPEADRAAAEALSLIHI